MKILVLTHEFPPVGGGGGRVARDIAAGLAAKGNEVFILTSAMRGLPVDSTVDGVCVKRIAASRKEAFRAGLGEMAEYDISAFRVGLSIIRSWKPDVIHAHFAVPAGAAAFALSKMTGIPYVLTVHLGDVPDAVPEKTDRWFRWLFPLTPPIWQDAARVVAVSEFTRGMALRRYPVKISVIPNGVALQSLPGRISENDPDAQVPVKIIFAGRFMEQKNPADLVQALALLPHLSWRCVMLGDGPLLESVREIVGKTGMADRFELPGWVSPEQVLDEFSSGDVLVLPSRSEGLSVVGVQALGMGLAMVLSDIGGNLELVRHGYNGFIFPAGNVSALAENLAKLLSNPALLLSAKQASQEMARKFDLVEIVRQYEVLFTELLSERNN